MGAGYPCEALEDGRAAAREGWDGPVGDVTPRTGSSELPALSYKTYNSDINGSCQVCPRGFVLLCKHLGILTVCPRDWGLGRHVSGARTFQEREAVLCLRLRSAGQRYGTQVGTGCTPGL